jgi:hypothetical protein
MHHPYICERDLKNHIFVHNLFVTKYLLKKFMSHFYPYITVNY